MKGFQAGRGPFAAIYGFIKVSGRVAHAENKWGFSIHAHLYPTNRANGLTGEEGGVRYRVDLEATQGFISDQDLPAMLDAYEKKFSELVYALRAADPVDGFPLTEEEKGQRNLQGFMKLHE